MTELPSLEPHWIYRIETPIAYEVMQKAAWNNHTFSDLPRMFNMFIFLVFFLLLLLLFFFKLNMVIFTNTYRFCTYRFCTQSYVSILIYETHTGNLLAMLVDIKASVFAVNSLFIYTRKSKISTPIC